MTKKQIKIEVNRDCGNTTASGVLESLGYNKIGKNQFERDDKEYKFIEWDYFNTYVYSITLEEI